MTERSESAAGGGPIRVLFVDDSEDDVRLLARELRRGQYEPAWERVETAGAMRAALAREAWDLVMSDFSIPGFGGLQALAIVQETGVDLPFILVSGTMGEDTAVEAMRAGAHDFILKGRFARLLPAIGRELREAAIRRDRRRTEQALRDSELRYRRIVETTQEGVWIIDASARTTFASRRLAEMLAFDVGDLIGRSIYELFDPSDHESVTRSLDSGRKGIPQPQALRFRRRDGSELWATLSTDPIVDESGRHLGTLAMVTDATERRKMEAQLLVADRLAAVGTLAAGVAHEINNPLASVIANLSLVSQESERLLQPLRDRPEAPIVREGLKDAREAAERVRTIVRDLKVFARPVEDQRGPTDVNAVLESSLRMAWNEIRHRARLVKELAPELPPADANESRLGQVFLNLIVNAAQAIPEGAFDRSEIRVITARNDAGGIDVSIRDSGAGIAPEDLPRVFSPFFTTKPVGVGTGLGLSICHRIITALGGQITVESAVGRGTTVRVALPVSAASAAAAPSGPVAARRATRRGRVLVIDDEPSIAAAIRRCLSSEHEVAAVSTAQEALDRIRGGERFDVILCDLMMPQLTGMDFHEALKSIASEQAAHIVFLTGGAFTAGARTFLEAVQNPHIEKPFDVQELRSLVNGRVR